MVHHHFTLRRRVKRRVTLLRRCIKRVVDRLLMSCLGKPVRYRMLPVSAVMSPNQTPSSTFAPSSSPSSKSRELLCRPHHQNKSASCRQNPESKDDLVALKISLLGDSQIGKTSFLVTNLPNFLFVHGTNFGARISYSIWEVGGDLKSQDNIPVACKDSVAILFMFDLTSRCTLNRQQSNINRNKFDDFIQLPIDLQWTIASQARAYAKALNATLFFSSATYNINVNKIFKFITAKLFDLPWTVERNLTIGEPIIDF
ncbi:septum-promoting GTP-binding protein 1 [Prunus yedoensis var. nudiflora]|uniref:Septum-promoting GTP-binding protein 1 n=1 Tax=Prunus yedoensis var. nudiflora TaxID=2094558 RepID=A0A314ZL78_PRUYE|nr:septum-promoting GTP-binding protein 1 [Prunus yedoensis var. nudiflora]